MSRLPRPRLSYANVVSSLALFIALGGTSYAVAKNSIGEKHLKPNAVTSPKIKDGTIASRDLAPGTALSGPRGPRGEQGPKGDAGSSDVLTVAGTVRPLAADKSVPATVVTLDDVPAGDWLLLATGSIVYQDPGASGSDYFRCWFTINGGPGIGAFVTRVGPDAAAAGALAVQAPVRLAAASTARLQCSHDEPLPVGNPRVDHVQFSAIRAGTLATR